MLPPMGPAIISAAVGIGDALLADTDAKNGRTSATRAYTTWGQAAVTGTGLLLGATRMGGLGPDVYEPLFNSGLTLAARNAAFRLLTRNASPAITAYGRLRATAPAPPAAHDHRLDGTPVGRAVPAAAATGFLRRATAPAI